MFVMVYDNNGLSKHCTSWFFALCLYMKKILVFKNSALLFSICHGKKQTTKLIASVMRSITMNPIGHVKFCQRSKIESHKFNFIFCPLFQQVMPQIINITNDISLYILRFTTNDAMLIRNNNCYIIQICLYMIGIQKLGHF